MSRFFQFAIAGPTGAAVPFWFIANDGNLVVNPITLASLDQQGIAERYDIIVDFSRFRIGDKLHLVNVLKQTSGNKPDAAVTLAQALQGDVADPVLGAMLQFRVVGSVQSVDVPGVTLTTANSCGSNDKSVVPLKLTDQIPVVAPVRTRVVRFGRVQNGDSRDPATGPVHARLLRGGVQLPLDHQRQRPDFALDERQPRVDGLSQGRRDRALDLHQ